MKRSFPWIALGLGLLLSVVLLRFSPLAAASETSLPMLTALFIAELGFIITAAAAVFDGQQVLAQRKLSAQAWTTLGNLLLAINFARMGFALWAGLPSE